MFDDIPENYKAQTADNEEEGWRYCQGDKNARRPPELLTRDHVARCIVREIKEGRGVPHGGVYLDIAWIKKNFERRGTHQAQAAEHVSPVQTAGRHRHHAGADGGRPDDALRDGRNPRRFRHADVARARLVCGGRMRGGNQRRESAWRQFAFRSFGFRKTRRRIRGEIREGEFVRRNRRSNDRSDSERSVEAIRTRRGGKSVFGCNTICKRRCRTKSGLCATKAK